MGKLKLSKLLSLDTLIIQQDADVKAFIASPTSIVIGTGLFISILNYLVKNDMISYKVLEGILEEYHTSRF